MIAIIDRSDDAAAREVVLRAFERSFTPGQVRLLDDIAAASRAQAVVVVVAPREQDADWIEPLLRRPVKLVLLGTIGPRIAGLAGITVTPLDEPAAASAACDPAPTYGLTESAARIVYADQGLGTASPLRQRSLCRFDFTNEWNNLGYGRIGICDEVWSIAVAARPVDAGVVGELRIGPDASAGAVVTLRDLPHASVLWFARPVGPVDGADWAIVERFVADHRAAELPCRPYLRDIPHGVTAALTMRLDCDEDIASSRPLFELYRGHGLPLSVAIKTDQPDTAEHLALLADLDQAGGSILSHSVTHAPNWGGSAEAAEREARDSKAWLESRVRGLNVRYAVSPFHQNPTYVPAALARAGYDGFVGGIIANDPEYLMARGGAAPFGPAGFVSHSQACMLHGDCLLAGDDPTRIYKQAFRQAKAFGQFFGYLDHPFSPRYAYGWASEADRVAIHAAYLDFIAAECAGEATLFVNEETCLDFMRAKSTTLIDYDSTRDAFAVSQGSAAGLPLSVGWRGRIEAAADHA
uniref:Polysaccharide deacetylase n=1 Tax=Rhodopseudomonas palustris (strain DX-1) TaxID=652103 RepID=E6VMZ8_RHOPX